jgi:hypothetical protein
MFKRTDAPISRKSIAIAAACIAAASTTHAAQFNWIGGAGSLNNFWSAQANWVNGSVPTSNSATQVNIQTNNISWQNIGNPMLIHRLDFAAGVSTDVSGNALDFHASGADTTGVIYQSSSFTSSIGSNLVLSDSLTINGPGSGLLQFVGNIRGTRRRVRSPRSGHPAAAEDSI